MKRLLSYITYIIVLGVITFWILRYGVVLKAEFKSTFNPIPYRTFLAIYPVIIGLLIGIPQFISTLGTEGRLTVDRVKLCVVGLPSLLFNIIPLTYFTGLSKFAGWIVSIELNTNGQLFIISGIVFGYTLITSFNKIQSHLDNNSFTARC